MTTYFKLFCISLGLGQVKTIFGPSAAARAEYGAERRDQDKLGGRALWPYKQFNHVLHMRSMCKIDRRGGGVVQNSFCRNFLNFVIQYQPFFNIQSQVKTIFRPRTWQRSECWDRKGQGGLALRLKTLLRNNQLKISVNCLAKIL